MTLQIKKVLVSDPVHQNCIEILQKHGIQVTHGVKLTPQELCQQIKEYDGLIVRSETKVTKEVLQAGAGKLKLVGRAGTGVDNIDIPTATQLGVYVLNTPGGNSLSACELTCALISAVARNVGSGIVSMKDGRWDRKSLMGTELYGKVLGVIGLGRIGREVANRMRSYGMKIVGFDPLINHDQANQMGIELYSDLNKMWPSCDYVTVHVPLNQHTKDLLNEVSMSKCKRGVKIINVARGGIVNEKHLLAALNNGQVGGAGLDVFSEEPPKSEFLWDLIKHPKVAATPHLGASTLEAQVRVAEEIAQQFVALAVPNSGFIVDGSVNSDVLSAMSCSSNKGLLTLCQAFGSIIASYLGLNGLQLEIVTQSNSGETKWVQSCIAEGLISSSGPGCLAKAQTQGLKSITYKHEKSAASLPTMIVKATSASGHIDLTGCCDTESARLTSVNNSTLDPSFTLSSKAKLIKVSDVPTALQQLINQGVTSFGVIKFSDGCIICVN